MGWKQLPGGYSKSPCRWINSEGEEWHIRHLFIAHRMKKIWDTDSPADPVWIQLRTFAACPPPDPTQNRERSDRFTLGWGSLSRRSLRYCHLSSCCRATAGKGNCSISRFSQVICSFLLYLSFSIVQPYVIYLFSALSTVGNQQEISHKMMILIAAARTLSVMQTALMRLESHSTS